MESLRHGPTRGAVAPSPAPNQARPLLTSDDVQRPDEALHSGGTRRQVNPMHPQCFDRLQGYCGIWTQGGAKCFDKRDAAGKLMAHC